MVLHRSNIFKRSSYDRANCFSKLSFYWMVKFFLEFQKKRLKTYDLEQCPEYDRSEKVGEKLEARWKEELQMVKIGGKPSLGRAIIKAIGWHYSFCFILLFCSSILNITQTLCIGYLVDALYDYNLGENESPEVRSKIYLTAVGVVVTQLCGIYIYNMYWFLARKGGISVRVACSRLIYRKSIRLSQSSLGKTNVGQIVNFLSSDVSRFDPASEFPSFFIQGPIEIIISTIILWPMLGTSFIIGLLVLLLYVPFQIFMGKFFGKIREKGAALTDERIRLMNEFIPAMRVIKLYAWEKPLALLVDQARKREVSKIRLTASLSALHIGLGTVADKLIMFLTLLTFVLHGNQLTARTVFVAVSLIKQLRNSITIYLPWGIQCGAESLIAIERIRNFLLLPEYKNTNLSGLASASARKPKIAFTNVTLSWSDDRDILLKNITFGVFPGQLMVIVGPVGSGKSSLLMSILGEINAKAGRAEVIGSVSYASQQPWIFAGTVRDNILFGNAYNSARYQRVISVAALERDLSLLPAGDQTFVGDRGASLSGGQKARINLARALYVQANIYLLDDPLSAVDAPVAKHIFENSIKDFLSDKITILVTHQLQFMEFADLILQLPHGKLSTKSSPKSLFFTPDECGIESTEKCSKIEDLTVDGEGTDTEEFKGIKLNKSLFWTYIFAGIRVTLLPFWLFFILGAEFFILFVEYYFSLWADSSERKGKLQLLHTMNPNATFHDMNFVDRLSQADNIILYSGLTLVLFLWCCTRNFAFFAVCMRSSIELHNRMVQSIVRASISFFDNNSPGVVLNRVSRDMGVVDDSLPQSLFWAVTIFGSTIAAFILMTYITPYLTGPAVFLLVSCSYLRSKYVYIAQDVKRLEGSTKTPVYSHLSSSLYGLTTIRAFGAQERFKETFDMYQDEHTSAYFTWIASTRFFITLMNTMSLIFTAMVVLTCLLAIDSLNGSSVGFVISAAISISIIIQWGMHTWTEVETMMTSVERIEEMRYIPSEAELDGPLPPPIWPDCGQIIFSNVNLRYEPDKPPVLRDINFKIQSKEKVGIIGRTGAGKTSIITALFRLTEPEGHIIIDGIDISTIGLHDLRRKISIIPQEPIIFTGSIRYNLDPFNVKSDTEILDALYQAQLMRAVHSMGGIDATLTDGGTNLSVGQRQLVCLARAILANNKILVLDEATANIDPTTDELIQQTIRQRFADCTVLTIAHRLRTIIDSDKILVMDAGAVVQFGDPATLVADRDGLLYSMIQATGKESAESLIKIAKRNTIA